MSLNRAVEVGVDGEVGLTDAVGVEATPAGRQPELNAPMPTQAITRTATRRKFSGSIGFLIRRQRFAAHDTELSKF